MPLLLPLPAIALIAAAAAAAGAARGFLDECGFDESLRAEGDLVADLLHTFFDDLSFVRASTEARERRDYGQPLAELRALTGQAKSAEALRQQLDKVVELMGPKLGHFKSAVDRCNRDVYPLLQAANLSADDETAVKSYLYYLKADAYRLMGEPAQAAEQIAEATVRRQDSHGVSVNDLERTHGMLELERVSRFNQEVDKLYGLNRGPNFRLLRLVHARSRADTAPLKDRRTCELDRALGPVARPSPRYGFRVLDDKPPQAAPAGSVYTRVNPDQDDFSGQSVADLSAKGILCEFAQKLVILGVVSNESSNYTDVVDEIRQVDTHFADALADRVVGPIRAGHHNEALLALNKYKDWASKPAQIRSGEAAAAAAPSTSTSPKSTSPRSKQSHDKILETYADYFRVEIYRRNRRGCVFLREIGELGAKLKRARQARVGVSVGRLLELEGRVALLAVKCFHKTLASIYGLTGREDYAELEAKRAAVGARERLVPFIKLDR